MQNSITPSIHRDPARFLATRVGRLVFSVAISIALFAAQSAWCASPALETLKEKGLVKKNNSWLLEDEIKALDLEKNLKDVEKKCRDAQLAFDEAIKNGKLARAQFEATKKELEQIQTLLKGNVNAAQQNRLVLENNSRVTLLEKCESQIVDLSDRIGNPAFRKSATDLSTARLELMTTLLFLQTNEPKFEEKYQALKDDPEVAAALKELGAGNRLGPTRNYKKEPARTATAEKLVLTDTLPLYLERTALVFDLVLNEKAVAPISDGRANEFTMLPASVLQKAGQKIGPDAPSVQLKAGSVSIACQLVKVESLRLGKHLLKDVDVVALPADARLPPAIGSKVLADFDVSLEPKEGKVIIKSNADIAKEKEKKGPSKPIGPAPALKF